MTALKAPQTPRHLIVVIGGAVAGSEAASLCADRGAISVIIEQNDRPFGKIEDGLPRWHYKLQDKEYAKIGENLAKPDVHFVPSTKLGEDVTIETLRETWGASAVLLASGAWRDRPLPVPDADTYDGKGLVYQNAFVHWYNHYADDGYDGPTYDVPDGSIVVGGGLASIDVVKIINFQLYKKALGERGIKVTTLELEHDGIPATLEKHGLTQAELGIQGVRLYYRRDKRSMPLATPPPNANEKQLAKIGDVRAKVMDKVITKYLVQFEGNHAPSEAIIEDGRMVGLRFQKTHTVDGRLVPIEGETVDVRAPMIVSSIGSIPKAIVGVPMKGELIDFADWDTGEVRGMENVFGLGNALTGKGNIKASRKNSTQISTRVMEAYLGVGDGSAAVDADGAHAAARANAEAAVDAATAKPAVSPETLAAAFSGIEAQWKRSGYDGDYEAWIQKVMPTGKE